MKKINFILALLVIGVVTMSFTPAPNALTNVNPNDGTELLLKIDLPSDVDAQGWGSTPRRLGSRVPEIMQRAEGTGSTGAVAPQLRHRRQALLPLHRAGRSDRAGAREARRIPSQPRLGGQVDDRPMYGRGVVVRRVSVGVAEAGGRVPHGFSRGVWRYVAGIGTPHSGQTPLKFPVRL